ncbi:MAG: NRDE family protein, partial [Syntrophotaleaceae bacterium]
MCLILLAWRQHADYPLVLAANRDEYYARPAAPAGPWPGQPEVVGGRDLLQGGSWLALHRAGRFAVVTNYRETPPAVEPPRSRGRLVSDFVLGSQSIAAYLAQVDGQDQLYRGFSLLVGDGRTLGYLSNRSA